MKNILDTKEYRQKYQTQPQEKSLHMKNKKGSPESMAYRRSTSQLAQTSRQHPSLTNTFINTTPCKAIPASVEHMVSYIKNSKHFINRFATITIHYTYIPVSFDITSLLTNIPIAQAIYILKEHYNTTEDIKLTHHCVISTYFQFYNRTNFSNKKEEPRWDYHSHL